MFERVLFPAPFSPSSAWTSPGAASKSTASFATTPGKRFVIPRIQTAEEAPGSPAPLSSGTELGACCPTRLAGRVDVRDRPDHASDEPLHRVQLVDARLRVRVEALPLRDPQLARLVVDRPAERVPLAGHDQRTLPGDRRLGRSGDLRPVRREAREAVLDRAVVEARLPGA